MHGIFRLNNEMNYRGSMIRKDLGLPHHPNPLFFILHVGGVAKW